MPSDPTPFPYPSPLARPCPDPTPQALPPPVHLPLPGSSAHACSTPEQVDSVVRFLHTQLLSKALGPRLYP